MEEFKNKRHISKESNPEKGASNFIENIINDDISKGLDKKNIHTRFPPEPNGYIHIGHAKAICLNFGLAKKYNGVCNLRFDDTNPITEEDEYVQAIKEDLRWLGFEWGENEYFASDYFDQLYNWAEKLIRKGVAYVDDQSAEEVAFTRGTPTKPGQKSPYRNRSIEENLDLFKRMRGGEFEDGSKVLRAKIDMSSPNMHLRDPALYRIKKASHHRTGDTWCIYPMYDFAHGQSDYIEGITHSICTLEFEVHRPLYNWLLDHIVEGKNRPYQYEFARLNLSYTIMSKRKLLELVEGGHVSGWDDPRMPTISGLRRRGYTPESIRNFSDRVGVAKRDNIIDVALLEFSIREDLNKKAFRKMAVLDPVKVVILNYPEGKVEKFQAKNNPENEEDGYRIIPFTRELYIERTDFLEDPPKKYFRLSPGGEVRLKYAYIIKCEEVVKDPMTGEITELRCSYDHETRSGSGNSRKVKGTIHWVSARYNRSVEVRLYDRLFMDEDPSGHKEKDFKEFLNPNSLAILKDAIIEDSIEGVRAYDNIQFERTGYFCVDPDTTKDNIIVNRTVSLRDTWLNVKRNLK